MAWLAQRPSAACARRTENAKPLGRARNARRLASASVINMPNAFANMPPESIFQSRRQSVGGEDHHRKQLNPLDYDHSVIDRDHGCRLRVFAANTAQFLDLLHPNQSDDLCCGARDAATLWETLQPYGKRMQLARRDILLAQINREHLLICMRARASLSICHRNFRGGWKR
jgi:hypothetical protein